MTTPLRQIRLKNGLSLRQLAEAVDSTAPHISRIERLRDSSGVRHRASLALAEAISRFFDGKLTRDEILFPEHHMHKRMGRKNKHNHNNRSASNATY